MNNDFMRLLVLFDLPVKTKKDTRVYNQFRKFLLKNGFYFFQNSVYVRVCRGTEHLNRTINKIKQNAPRKGVVGLLYVTDKQFTRMQIIVGKPTPTERKIGSKQVVLF